MEEEKTRAERTAHAGLWAPFPSLASQEVPWSWGQPADPRALESHHPVVDDPGPPQPTWTEAM